MPDDTRTVILTQPEDDQLHLDHGAVAIRGATGVPLTHEHAGRVVHETPHGQPLVHMVCWDTDTPCRVKVAGDPDAPLPVEITHRFEGDHHQTLDVQPMQHTLAVDTALHAPVHHALQLRTPLQVRFCNTWTVESDYTISVRIGNRDLLGIRVQGATTATPQPCDEPCPPVGAGPSVPIARPAQAGGDR